MTFPSVPGNGIFFFYRINLFVATRQHSSENCWIRKLFFQANLWDLNQYYPHVFRSWGGYWNFTHSEASPFVQYFIRIFCRMCICPKTYILRRRKLLYIQLKKKSKEKDFSFKYIWKPLQHFLLLFFGNWYLFDP